MKLTKRYPTKALQDLVKSFWVLEIDSDEAFEQRIVPFGGVELIIHLKNPLFKWGEDRSAELEPVAFVEGQYLRPKFVRSKEAAKLVGISFYPWATKVLFGTPARIFTEQLIPLEDLAPTISGQFSNIVSDDDDSHVILAKVEGLLLAMNRRALQQKENEILSFIQSNFDQPKLLFEIYKNIGISRRRYEQLFCELVGISVLKLHSKVKFQHAVKVLRSGVYERLTDVALAANYYDQPEFCRQFRHFAGVSAREYLREGGSCFSALMS